MTTITTTSSTALSPYCTPSHEAVNLSLDNWVIWDTYLYPIEIVPSNTYAPGIDPNAITYWMPGPDTYQNMTMNQTLTPICTNTPYDFFMYAGSSGAYLGTQGVFSITVTIYLDDVALIPTFVPCGSEGDICSYGIAAPNGGEGGYMVYKATSVVPASPQPTLAIKLENIQPWTTTIPVASAMLIAGLSFHVS